MNFKLAAFADEADVKIDGQIKAMARNGVELLEIRGVDGQNIADISPEKAKEVRSKLEDNNMAVWSIGSPFGKIGINDDFNSHLDKFKRGLDIAQILGAENIRLFSFYVSEPQKAEYKNKVMDYLNCFVEAARGTDLVLCHENEKGIYGDMAIYCEEIHKEIPSLKGIFDPANFVQCGQDTIKAWELLSPYIKYMHIKDALENGNVVPAGKGIGNLPYLLQQYKGTVLTLEPHLSVFPGFEKLEADKKTQMGQYHYETSNDAFDAAVNALKELIK